MYPTDQCYIVINLSHLDVPLCIFIASEFLLLYLLQNIEAHKKSLKKVWFELVD